MSIADISKQIEGTRLEECASEVHESYPVGSVGHMIVRGERTYLGSVIELPCGHWQAHIPDGEKRKDPFLAVQDVLGFRETMISGNLSTVR